MSQPTGVIPLTPTIFQSTDQFITKNLFQRHYEMIECVGSGTLSN